MHRCESAITKGFMLTPAKRWHAGTLNVGAETLLRVAQTLKRLIRAQAHDVRRLTINVRRNIYELETACLAAGIGTKSTAFIHYWPPLYRMANRQAHLHPLAWTKSARITSPLK
jgi:hypothetical protein